MVSKTRGLTNFVPLSNLALLLIMFSPCQPYSLEILQTPVENLLILNIDAERVCCAEVNNGNGD